MPERQSKLRLAALAALGLLVGAPANIGCRTADAQERITLSLSELPASAGLGSNGTWQSVAWRGDDWHRFPGRAELELAHGLGEEPQLVMVYLSFAPDGDPSALAAGDLAQIISVDSIAVTLLNQTNQDYFLRVVIE